MRNTARREKFRRHRSGNRGADEAFADLRD
jgi:hypothetical protein